MQTAQPSIDFQQAVHHQRLLNEVIDGLTSHPKTLNPKFFYDEKGSKLFEEICAQPEYYPTRTESAILKDRIESIASVLGQTDILLEYGSGAAEKVRTLLDHLPKLSAYVPIEISKEILFKTSEKLQNEYPKLRIIPICADFTSELELPLFHISRSTVRPLGTLPRKVAFFPGSTIGNFSPDQALAFLKRSLDHVGTGGGLLIGIDLKKDRKILEAAYNDRRGVTAEFNLNILTHLNQQFETDFEPSGFYHEAFFNEKESRIEMHLVASRSQRVHVGEYEISLQRGEYIHTESSYKYSIEEFKRLAANAGFSLEAAWTDPQELFGVLYFEVAS